MVLDAVYDPVNWTTGYRPSDANIPFSVRLGADHGAQQALDAFLAACTADARCAFRQPGIDLHAKWNQLLDRQAAAPVTITDSATGRLATIRYQDVISRAISSRVIGSLTNADNSPDLARFLQSLTTAPAATFKPSETAITTPFDGLLGGGATQCADATNPTDPNVWPRYAAVTDRRYRGFGAYYTYLSLPCVRFPSADPDRYAGPWDQHTASTVLLLGNARLLTLDTFGHGSLGHSQCIDDDVNAYFLRLRMPATDTVCEPNHGPFDGK